LQGSSWLHASSDSHGNKPVTGDFFAKCNNKLAAKVAASRKQKCWQQHSESILKLIQQQQSTMGEPAAQGKQ